VERKRERSGEWMSKQERGGLVHFLDVHRKNRGKVRRTEEESPGKKRKTKVKPGGIENEGKGRERGGETGLFWLGGPDSRLQFLAVKTCGNIQKMYA